MGALTSPNNLNNSIRILMTKIAKSSKDHPQYHTLRAMVTGAYDLQKLRIASGNKLVAAFRQERLGLGCHEKEATDSEAKRILVDLRVRNKRITDGITEKITDKNFKSIAKGDDLISDYTKYSLVRNYEMLLAQEERQFNDLRMVLKNFPIYNEFLRKTRGVGPAMSGVILSSIDIYQCNTVSQLYAYCGLDVVISPDGVAKGRSSRKEHLVERAYIDKDGNQKTKMSLSHNRFLKSKLVSVLGGSFLKAGKPGYANVYYNIKHRYQNRPDLKDRTDKHIHNMALRYMVKIFLSDMFKAWRTIEGLPVRISYEEEKLGIKHSKQVNYLQEVFDDSFFDEDIAA